MIRLILISLVTVLTLGSSNIIAYENAPIERNCEKSMWQGSINNSAYCESGRVSDELVVAVNRKVPEGKPQVPMVTEESVARPALQRPREVIITGNSRPKSWRQQLPGFTLDDPGRTGDDKLFARADRPAPIPEVAFPDEQKQSPDTPAQRKVDVTPQSQSIEVSDKKSVTVQLGAFKNDKGVERFLRDNQLAHLNLVKQVYERAGKHWHVITFGRFTDKKTAYKAWRIAAKNAADIDVWIRPVFR